MTINSQKNQTTVSLSAANNEFLKYHLQVTSGAGAVFGWTDDNGTAILPALGSPGAADITWNLKSAVVGGQVQMTVPESAGYLRTETSPNIIVYSLMLFFGTALKYTLTIDHCDKNGNVIEGLVNIDFTGVLGEQAPHVEVVNI